MDSSSGARIHLVGWASQGGSQSSIGVSLGLSRSSQLRDGQVPSVGTRQFFWSVKYQKTKKAFAPVALISTVLKFNTEFCTFG